MSTRCNVIIKDSDGKLIFYRHSDGYPEGVKESLGLFMQFLREGKIRDNVGQAAGWLVLIGADEYAKAGYSGTVEGLRGGDNKEEPKHSFSDWKCGAYEPSTCIHGDIEFLYEIDLTAQTLNGWRHDGDKKGCKVEV